MGIHPKDIGHDNPRMQCSVCGKWKRLINKKADERGLTQEFYGGCKFTEGDHLAGDGLYVCNGCCNTKCKKLNETKGE